MAEEIEPCFHNPRLFTAAFMSIRSIKGYEVLIYRAEGLFIHLCLESQAGMLGYKEVECDRMWRNVVGACWGFRQIHNCSKPDSAMGRRLISEKESIRADLWDLKQISIVVQIRSNEGKILALPAFLPPSLLTPPSLPPSHLPSLPPFLLIYIS